MTQCVTVECIAYWTMMIITTMMMMSQGFGHCVGAPAIMDSSAVKPVSLVKVQKLLAMWKPTNIILEVYCNWKTFS